ncbi:tyrosine-type recombinase/integrase [Photobacterium leiognathi]|uniref:tyrosine-type recombinase/integrase n=1 Tax=Photobacterium leiognathi TaxID=553611 RepID=UPI002980CDDC|nr:tyrosine-type recombinase/integrase [Photobacterium leiognathi]
MANNSTYPIIKQNQVTLSQLKSQHSVIQQWRQKQQQLKRFKLNFPDLSNSFDPNWSLLPDVMIQLQHFEATRGGYSPHTLKMLALVLRKWDEYCKAEAIYSFPISPQILLGWLQGLKLVGLSINTLKQYRAQMGLFHTLMAVDDVTKQPIIKHFFHSLAKDEMELTGNQLIELQAKPFRKCHLLQLMDCWGNHTQPLRYRDLTVLTVAYGTLLREGEIGKIRKKHVNILDNGDINIERVTSKTSISPEPKRLTGRFSAILTRYIVTYCQCLDDDDFLFCWLTTQGKRPAGYRQTPMSGMTIDRIYQRAHKTLRLKSDNVTKSITHRHVWSGHSSRVGALQDGYAAGLSLTQLIQLGDWKNNAMVLRYLRGLNNKTSPNLLLQD